MDNADIAQRSSQPVEPFSVATLASMYVSMVEAPSTINDAYSNLIAARILLYQSDIII